MMSHVKISDGDASSHGHAAYRAPIERSGNWLSDDDLTFEVLFLEGQLPRVFAEVASSHVAWAGRGLPCQASLHHVSPCTIGPSSDSELGLACTCVCSSCLTVSECARVLCEALSGLVPSALP